MSKKTVINHPATTPVFWVIKCGTYLSLSLIAAGLVWTLLDPDVPTQVSSPMPAAEVIKGLAQGNPYALIQVGIVTLMATPFLGWIVAGVSYWRKGERLYLVLAVVIMLAVGLGVWMSRKS